jgi:DNA invertase Pin-like site-specific DNA recombinase
MLGIKGTMSVVELKILKMRMQDGKEEKARRGELKPTFRTFESGLFGFLKPQKLFNNRMLR